MDASVNVQWVLRRIGPPPSIPEIPQVAELKQGTTTFGRGAGVDFYIDSRVLKNFISRRHAVIVGEVGENSQLHFTLYNHGLNGTYVNDVRIGNVKHLQEGDKVTFGHKNGYKVKVGETALQDDSEFQYRLERVVTPRQAVSPLGERLCQEVSKGVTCLSEYDRSECHFYSPLKNGRSPSKDSSQDVDLSSAKTKHSEETSSRSADKQSQGVGLKSPVCENSEAVGSTKAQTLTETKQLVPSPSKSPRHGVLGNGDHKLPCRRHSSDCVPNSTAFVKDTDSKLPATDKTALQPNTSISKISGNGNASPRILRDRSRSPVSKPDISRSPRSLRDRSQSPKPNSKLSRSPRPVHSSSRSPRPRRNRSRSKSPTPRQLLDVPKPRDEAREDGTLLMGYDEPPVLTPESIVRTPSPSCNIIMECDDADDFGEIESDQESIGWEIPPTPGHSLVEASPQPHATSHSRHNVSAHRTAASKTMNRRGSSDIDETDYGGERRAHYKRSDHGKGNHVSKHPDKEHVLFSKTKGVSKQKKPDMSSSLTEVQRTITSSIKSKESVQSKSRKSRDSVNSDSDACDSVSSSTHSSDKQSSRKRQLSSGSDSDSRHKMPKKTSRESNSREKPHMPALEKENGFSTGYSSRKQVASSDRSKDRSSAAITQLKDVRVTIERVSSKDFSREKQRPDSSTSSKHRSHDHSAAAREKTQSSKDRPSSKESKTGPTPVTKTADRKPSSQGEPLFGKEKDRPQKPVQSKPKSSPVVGGIDFSGDWLMKEIDKTKRPPPKPQSRDRSRQKERDKSKESTREKSDSIKRGETKPSGQRLNARGSRQNSQSNRPSSGDERDGTRNVRKIAMRRPRARKTSEDKKETQKSSAPSGRPSRRKDARRKRPRKKKTDDDIYSDEGDDDVFDEEEDEGWDLEEGVTWYEEECCEADACSRPKDRRVEWVQCDDCDKWYHTVCVGCNLEEVKDEDFHCGCV